MLHQFLSNNRSELIERCRAKVAERPSPKTTKREGQDGIPVFLDQLIKTLKLEQTSKPMRSREVSGPSGGEDSENSELGVSAGRHGISLLQSGYTLEQVVHDYGDLCQSITDLAFELHEPMAIDEFRTLNRCLDNAIATAVTEFATQRDLVVEDSHSRESNRRLGFFAHELRNHIHTAALALTIIKEQGVGLGGAMGALLDRSLAGLNRLVDRSLAEVRLNAAMPLQPRLFSLADFIREVKMSASLETGPNNCTLIVSDVDETLALEADRDLILAAVGNLVQNAFKFTHAGSQVTVRAHAAGDRVHIDVSDCCGGLPDKFADTMFQPFTQGGKNKTGLGLGLSISRRSVEANDGKLCVMDVPGTGCVFTIDLPRHVLPRFASPLEAMGPN